MMHQLTIIFPSARRFRVTFTGPRERKRERDAERRAETFMTRYDADTHRAHIMRHLPEGEGS